MKWNISVNDHRRIAIAVYGALATALNDPHISEPQLVANLTFHIPKRINAITLESNVQIRAGSIFVHGQPFVKWASMPEPTPRSVEIGDLLLLQTTLQKRRPLCQRALLLQAKKTLHLPARPDNNNQLVLYANWPSFKYVRSGSLTNEHRHIVEPDMYDATQYLLLNSSFAPPHQHCHYYFHRYCAAHTAQPTLPNLSRYQCFALELAEFILGDAGKSYSTPPEQGDIGWNRVINDLCSLTASGLSCYVKRATQETSSSRGQGLFYLMGDSSAFCMLTSLDAGFSRKYSNHFRKDEPPMVIGDWPGESSDNEGLSIIEISVDVERGVPMP